MAGASKPGPICAVTQSRPTVFDGTLYLQASFTPGVVGGSTDRTAEFDALRSALASLEATALNFGRAMINDATVRENYIRKIRAMSDEILRDVRAGRATAGDGARFAVELRNRIMDEARAASSSVGRAQAERMKAAGKSVEILIEERTTKLFPGRTFADLAAAERRVVFEDIIQAAGRSRPAVNASIPRWRLMGRGCLVFTVGIAVFNIWTAQNKIHAGLKEGIVLGSGAAGGALAGAATGLVCGPGAPICSTALFIVGGIMGALAGVAATNYYDAELLELADWVGEGF